jgi:hypothetical protein
MDLSWLNKIAPQAISKAAVALRQRTTDHEAFMSQSIEDELAIAFEQYAEPPSIFLEGMKSRYAGIAFTRLLPKVSRVDDGKAASWLARFKLNNYETSLFQIFVEQLFRTYVSEESQASLGPLTTTALRDISVEALQSTVPPLLPQSLMRVLSSLNPTFNDLATVVTQLVSSPSDIARIAPFNTTAGSYTALCTKVLLASPSRTAAQYFIGSQQNALEQIYGSDVSAAFMSMPLRLFSEIVATALSSIQRSEPYWLQAGRIAPKLKTYIEDRIKSPDTNPALWRFISPELILAYKMRLRAEIVDDFFDSRTDPNRANFWKSFTAAMESTPITMGSRKQVFLMRFKNVGVIETKQAGMGAAYFYSIENIEAVFMKPENQARDHGFYKTMAPCPSLASLPHTWKWQDKFRDYLRSTYGILPNEKM